MARTYKRDKNGRFASTGSARSGSGGTSKAAQSRKANTARASELRAKGTTGLGGRVKAKGFTGGKSAQANAGGLRARGAGIRSKAAAPGSFKAMKAQSRANQAARQRAASKAGMKPGKFSKKAPVSGAKSAYKKLRSDARKTGYMNTYSDGNRYSSAAGASKRKLSNFIKKRGTGKR